MQADSSLEQVSRAWGRQSAGLPCWPVPAALPSARGELVELLERLPDERIELMPGAPDPGADMPPQPLPATRAELMERMDRGTYVLRAGDMVPSFPPARDWIERWRVFLAQLFDVGTAARTDLRVDLYLSAPGAHSKFHADPSHNFAHQVVGERTLRTFRPDDERLIDARNRALIFLQRGSYPAYRPELADSARTHAMRPGLASYLPPLGGHWVSNGDALSVSYTVSVRTPQVMREKHCHALNARLERLGLQGAEFGRHPLRDSVKARLEACLRRVLPAR